MSELVKYSGEGLSDLEKVIFEAQLSKRVHESSDNELKHAITSGFTTANFNLGIKPPSKEELESFLKERQILESKILQDIKFHFKGFSLDDIKNAFELGSKGTFKSKPDEVLFISPEKIYSWFKGYKETIKEPTLKKKLAIDSKKDKQQGYSEEEKQKLRNEAEKLDKKSLVEEYNKFLNGNTPYDPLNVLYDFLDRKAKVQLSDDRKRELYREASEEFKRAHLNSNSIEDHFKNKKILQEMEKGSTKIQAIIKMLAKQKALKAIFQDIKDLEMTMEEYLE